MLTIAQRKLRRGKLGSSDMAAVLGQDPFKSAADVWLEKTGQAGGFDGNEATDRGNRLEPVLIAWAEDQLDADFESDVMVEHPTCPHLVANLDAVSLDRTEIIEAKTTVIEDGYGEEGSDEIPDRVLIQAHHQFSCLPSAKIAHVPVLLPGFRKFDWRMYRVRRNDELVAIVEKSGIDFMDKFVLPRVRPTDFKPSLEVVKRMRRLPGKSIDLPDEAIAAYEQVQAMRKQNTELEKACKSAEAGLLAMLGDAEQGVLPDRRAMTYMLTARAGYTVEPTEFRTLRFLKSAKI
jgi:putative phage-type endonuclease